MKFHRIRVNWSSWTFGIGIWWWSPKKDRAFGINFGPIHLIWSREKGY